MDVEVNWLAVVLAAASSMVVGSVWYSKAMFLSSWAKLARVDMSKPGAPAWIPITITVIVSTVTAYVLAHVTYLANFFFGNSFLQDALTTAFWLWLGLTAARFITHDAFEGRPRKLTLMNIAHELVTLLVMALIIGLLKP